MFQYAFARALHEKYYPNYELTFNFCEYDENINCNFLRDFCIHDCRIVNIPFKKCLTPLQVCAQVMRSLFTRFTLRFFPDKAYIIDAAFTQRFMNMLGQYEPIFNSVYVEPHKSCSKNIICSSFFEAHEYFDCIRDILLKEFTPVHDVLPHNTELLNEIQNSESVCVTIRRGDFLKLPSFNVCNEEYFISCMKTIREEIPYCKFFIFSDNVEDVKCHFHFPFDVTYERGGDPVWEKLRLMYNCKHFIISNSTFSWWAQYLSRNDNKIVYAPDPWRWNEDCSGMYMPYMRKIKCRK